MNRDIKKDAYDNPIIKKYLTSEEIQYLKDNYLKIFLEADPKAKTILEKLPLQEMIDLEVAEKERIKKGHSNK